MNRPTIGGFSCSCGLQPRCSDCFNTEQLIRPGSIGAKVASSRDNDTEADLEAWTQFLDRWTLDGQLPADITAKLTAGKSIVINFDILASDVKTYGNDPPNEHHGISLGVEMLAPTARPCESSKYWIRAVLRWMYVHELDEWIMIDGQRPFDPHNDREPPTPANS